MINPAQSAPAAVKGKNQSIKKLSIAYNELMILSEERAKHAAQLLMANDELAYQNQEKEKRAAELAVANKELAYQNEEKGKRAEELLIANEELAHQNKEKGDRATELDIAIKELGYQNHEKEKRADELLMANKELAYQNEEKEKRAAELAIANNELIYQSQEKEKRAEELLIANKELAYQNAEKEKRAAELSTANKELAYQNHEKEKRADELLMANKELAYQNAEKEKRAAELVIAIKELAYQNTEKEKRAAELIVANNELAYQNEEKGKRAAELIIANTALVHQNEEKEKCAAELKAINDSLQKSEREVYQLNMNLEKKVKRRTEELEAANKGLETFSYTVSHDLRAPISAILGFTKIIQEEYSSGLHSEAIELFDYIHDSGMRMRSIVDDLLQLAKCGADAVSRTTLDMMELVQGAWAELAINTPHHAELKLSPLPEIQGDRAMIRVVLTNLLSNAVKYSSKEEAPLIEIWSEKGTNETTFLIRDNGAGFDMGHSSRLFIAFQRLHGMNEYEGVGIGLALVKRIIEKHGGSVSAEGVAGMGATFSFSLPG